MSNQQVSRNIFATHDFENLDNAGFNIAEYSKMKFGDDTAAKNFGYALAESFFEANKALVLGQQLVVFASPYNYVLNAATIMTKHFIDRLNILSVTFGGHAVEYSIVHRKTSYVNDYGFLSANERKKLIDGDSFSINKSFTDDKALLFVDDVRITGTHELKIVELLEKENISLSNVHFLYHAKLSSSTVDPGIEAKLNFAAISSIADFVSIAHTNNHHMIIRPVKYILSQAEHEMKQLMLMLPQKSIVAAYHATLAEGYFKIPGYHKNFNLLKTAAEKYI